MSAGAGAGALTRRRLLQQGAGVVFVATTGGLSVLPVQAARAQSVASAMRDLAPGSLDTWIAMDASGAVTAFFGKMDMGQGVDTAIAQVVAEELDVDVGRVSVVMGDTHQTPNQGGASGSSACRLGANSLRNAAAEARRVLVARAAAQLGVEPATLRVADGQVYRPGEARPATSYAALIGQGFDTTLQWNNQQGNNLLVRGEATVKSPDQYTVVGTPVPRKDIAGKVLATTEYCHHVRLPGMLHGRAVRPPVAGAVPVSVDEASIAGIPGARVLREGDFIAVVAPQEWHAVRAAGALKVQWSEVRAPFPPMAALFDHIRKAPKARDSSTGGFGGGTPYDPTAALGAIGRAARQVEAEYEVGFQSHARMSPSIGVADVKPDSALVYSDTQKPHDTRNGLAKFLGLPPDKVRVVWKPGSGSYGRSDADEAAYEAALLSKLSGRPVRVQWMRAEGHAWDPKAPACVISCRAGLTEAGDVSGWFYRARGFSGWDVAFNASDPKDTLVGQLTRWPRGDLHNFGVPGGSYAFADAVKYWETVAPLLDRASPLRCSHMRAPQEPQLYFAQESFIDEVAAAAGRDPVAFRRAWLRDPREIAVLEAVAKLANWQARPSPAPAQSGRIQRGRGISLCSSFGGHVATVCDVEVDRETGRIWPRRFHVAHDCGLILNPKGLLTTIEGNIVQGVSRSLFEEVRFDERNVRSADWATYPILDIGDAPESVEIVMLNRPELPAGGAGEPAHVTVPAAIGNAVFDATGRRLRRMPLRMT
jgi:CO/xanthine dehydrogenase Mo-binding subunit